MTATLTKSTKPTPEEIRATLPGFSGTEQYHRLAMYRWLMATDGVAYLAEAAQCYWLVDLIGSHLATNAKLRAETFQVWTLTLTRERSGFMAVARCKDDEPGNVLVEQWIPHTDFPLPEGVTLWVEQTGDENGKVLFVVLLPGEH